MPRQRGHRAAGHVRATGFRFAVDVHHAPQGGGEFHDLRHPRGAVSEEVELLPSRETLALFNYANVSATNVALASNSYTYYSDASASACQAVVVTQS